MTGKIKELTSDDFDKFVKEDKVVVDFWAEWCGPCKMMGPIFEEAAKDLKDKAKFGKVNVDEIQSLRKDLELCLYRQLCSLEMANRSTKL